ncbi:iron chelate uptake ABC transporter family permease subunit [Paenirhodobacter enshiensis]|uniref:iron chelate uptake ABC transporter family permease subunit n=1 Tax=Paenirhodobacter enshiensis TaxID=1105367 RepID=UPI0035AE0CB6
MSPERISPDRTGLRLAVLTLLLLVAVLGWLFQGLAGNRAFILGLRLDRLQALALIGAAVAVATVLFQTVAQNRILTPSIMGFDALYVMVQTLAVAGLGITGYTTLPAGAKFLAEAALMTAMAVMLFGTLLGRGGAGANDIGRTILTGVILGILFRSAASLGARLLDPNAYAVVQAVSFANFGKPAAGLTLWAAAIVVPAIAVALWLGPRLDVLGLGRERAVSLGLGHRRLVVGVLVLVAVLVAASTALVGPVTFFGLIVAGLAQALFPGAPHRVRLCAAMLIACLMLIGGQWLFERGLGQRATLSVVIEFAGGLMFLALLLKGRLR